MYLQSHIKVGLVQIGDKFGDQYYFPYAIGLLQAYAQKNLKNYQDFEFLTPIYKKLNINKLVKYLLGANIIFFSTYIWNYKINLEIARRIKRKKVDCVIVFGGPQIPESPGGIKKFLKKYPFVDIGCYNEGEIPFLSILENLKERDWRGVPSIGFFDNVKHFLYTPKYASIEELDKIPSPYLEGIFDSLIKANPQEKWSALIETNRGCPYGCAFCYWGSRAEKKIYCHSIDRVFKEIDWFSQKKIEFVFCCDANFGLLERDVDIARKISRNKKKYGYPMALSVQSAKNFPDRIFESQKILSDYGLQKGVNLAFQSLNEDTLKSINRVNIDNRIYRDLQMKFTRNNIPTFSDMIIGLPKEKYETFADGVNNLIECGQHNRIQFINLAILPNTQMDKPAYQRKFGLVVKEVKLFPHHTTLDSNSQIQATQKLAIGTSTMPKEEWVKTRIFCWMTSLLYFNKLLQMPIAVINKIYQISYRDLIEVFTKKSNKHLQISKILELFLKKANGIQKGNPEHIGSKKWLNIWWPVDEYVFIKLCIEGGLEAFYEEAESVICSFLKKKKINFTPELLHDAITLNRNLIKLPFLDKDLYIFLHYNIYEVYQGVLNMVDIPVKNGIYKYRINRSGTRWKSWDDWLRDVVWYATKRGAYFYNCIKV